MSRRNTMNSLKVLATTADESIRIDAKFVKVTGV